MSISITISGATVEEFRNKFEVVATWLHSGCFATPSYTPPLPPIVLPQPDLFPATDTVGEASHAEPAKPRGRPKKAIEQPAEPQPDTAQKVYSLEEAKEAGHLVISAVGTQKLRDLLTEFGVQRIAELHNDKFGPFVTACKKLTGA